ncbi:MAG: winged helix-turn-helix domain-containing protein [Proteobacteria bacterium]|nr:winged helix-turn-helix domain-containing protein [Pseudomonadota bacterium]
MLQPLARRMRFEAFELDLMRNELSRGQDIVPLRRQSFEALRYLVEHAGHTVSRKEIVRAVWQSPPADPDGSVAQCIKEIRQALGVDARWMIRTVSGTGYQFVAVVESPVAATLPDTRTDPQNQPTAMRFAVALGRRKILISLLVGSITLGAFVFWTKLVADEQRDAETVSYEYVPFGKMPTSIEMVITTSNGRTMKCVGGVVGAKPRICNWN